MKKRPIFQRRSAGTTRRRLIRSLLVIGVAWLAMAMWGVFKPLPEGVSVATPMRPADGVRFLADYTFVDAEGERQVEQRIFDRVLGHIGRAERLVVLDMFLFNDFAGNPDGDDMRPLSDEVAEALIRSKTERPRLRAILITDPINHLYGGLDLALFDRLDAAGVEVVTTDLTRLRDSNPTWSGLWRLCCQWFGNSDDGGWLPNPMGEQKVTLRSLLELLNFKANHRKTLVADTPTGWVGLVTSGNPHDASSAHSNIALEVRGVAALDLLATECAVVRFSAPDLDWPELQRPAAPTADDVPALQILTEAEIRDAVLEALARAGSGDEVDLAMFYLSHRGVVRALRDAHARGARVRALLDPNHHAFGREKNGIPNRQVAAELTEAGVEVRWCHTTGEQCHDKLVLVRYQGRPSELIAGSANFTRRNLDDYNLETNVRVVAPVGHAAIRDAGAWFERRWSNADGRQFSLDYDAWDEDGWIKSLVYRIMEATGLSTF
ncbi:MAG: phospholipase D family protein [Wenzhouxiangellaceae bacterium]